MATDFRKFLKKVSWNDVPHVPEAGLIPYRVVDEHGATKGLFTGYFEPLLRGSRTKKHPYIHAVYRAPSVTPKVTRRDVANGALDGQNLELLYTDDAVDLFFAHVQGSAAVLLHDEDCDRSPASLCERSLAASEHIVRIGFAAKSGHPYTAIGKTLKDMGAFQTSSGPLPITMQSIKAWLRANPEQQVDVFCSNASFIFFKMIDGAGPIGASGEVLTPEASLAIDDSTWPYGLDVIVATTHPIEQNKPFIRKLRTADKGSAIRGTIRGDIYFGSGDAAGALAGAMNAQGEMWVLLPD
ncbi:MAG: MltA domain-containing protein [Alphaproteobacteria bacterium]|nr:MltA domain-containing protein [Alphaproteobacteria bacterium]